MRPILFLLPFAVAAVPAVAAEVVAVPAFDSVQLRGGGSVVVRPGPQRVIIISGSTQFTELRVDHRGQLRIDACDGRCPRNYDLRIEIHSPTVPDLAINGGGSIVAAPGFAPQGQLSAAVSGGGQIDARALAASKVSAAVNGGGEVLTGNSSSLSAAVNGGGLIQYSGNPHVSSAVRGGGAVVRAN